MNDKQLINEGLDQAFPIATVPPEDLTVGRWLLLSLIQSNGNKYRAYGEVVDIPAQYTDGYQHQDATHPSTDLLFIDVYEDNPMAPYYDSPDRRPVQLHANVPILKGLWLRLKTEEYQDAIRVEGLLTRTRTDEGVQDIVLSGDHLSPDASTMTPGSLYMDPPTDPDDHNNHVAVLEMFKEWYEEVFPGASLRFTSILSDVDITIPLDDIPTDEDDVAAEDAFERFNRSIREVLAERKPRWTLSLGPVAVVKSGMAHRVVALKDVPKTAKYNGGAVPLYDDSQGGGDTVDPLARSPYVPPVDPLDDVFEEFFREHAKKEED